MSPLNRLPVPSERVLRIGKRVVIVALAVFVVWALVSFARLGQAAEDNARALETAQQEREALRAENAEQDRAIDKRETAISKANKRLRSAGKAPVTVPQQPVSVPKVDGEPVLTSDDVLTLIEAEVKVQHPDLTAAQKRALTDAAAVKAAARIPKPRDGRDGPTINDLRPIVRAEVAKIPVPADGTDGQDGTDGASPTAEDVATAVTVLCGGSCKGDTGEKGEKGDVGAKGDTGATGPAGADGAPGKDGSNGTDGAPGRGITSVTCETDGTWTFTWTDGTTSTVAGPCRVTEPEPTPTDPTPSPTSSEPTPTATTGATP